MTQSKIVRVGLLGLGTVGSGVVKTLHAKNETFLLETGMKFEIAKVLVRNLTKPRNVSIPLNLLTTDVNEILEDESIEVLIEVMGGRDFASEVIESGMKLGKHVITANKELLATEGRRLQNLANDHGVKFLYEASVCGGIPILRMLQSYFSVNQIKQISGIVNGTTNYILSEMTEKQSSFAETLQKAQELGYAESDPASDVDGFDAAYKLAILSSLAFKQEVLPKDVTRQGIATITPLDLILVGQLGGCVKLVATAKRLQNPTRIRANVGLCAVSNDHSLATIQGVQNAITIETDVVGELSWSGPGAGEFPTASAVTEDLLSIYQGTVPSMNTPIVSNESDGCRESDSEVLEYYVSVTDAMIHSSVIQDAWKVYPQYGIQTVSTAIDFMDHSQNLYSVAQILSGNQISIDLFIQSLLMRVPQADVKCFSALSGKKGWTIQGSPLSARDLEHSQVV